MEQAGHPLHVIHEYAIERREAEDLARLVGRLSKRTLITIPGMSKRRAETLPFAALVLERILRTARPARILFSAHGLREGHIFDQLSPEEKARDPLIAACQELAQLDGRFGDTGELLDDWIAPLFKGDDARRLRLRRAACTLSDIGWREHPDYRAEQVFARIVHLPVGGIDHVGRISIAYAIFVRYGSEEPTAEMAKLLTMLSDDDRDYWQRVGLGAAAGILRQRRDAGRARGKPPSAWATRGSACCCPRGRRRCSARASSAASMRWAAPSTATSNSRSRVKNRSSAQLDLARDLHHRARLAVLRAGDAVLAAIDARGPAAAGRLTPAKRERWTLVSASVSVASTRARRRGRSNGWFPGRPPARPRASAQNTSAGTSVPRLSAA